jgi:hypothetical protein
MLGNKSQLAVQILENFFLAHGIADDDHLAMVNFAVEVGF